MKGVALALSTSLGLRVSLPRPRRNGRGAVGDRQAALGLLRDQIRSCVPSSFSIRRA